MFLTVSLMRKPWLFERATLDIALGFSYRQRQRGTGRMDGTVKDIGTTAFTAGKRRLVIFREIASVHIRYDRDRS